MRGKSGKGKGGNMRLILDPNRRSSEVLSFEESLRRKVVGQDRAVRQLARVYQVFRSRICFFWVPPARARPAWWKLPPKRCWEMNEPSSRLTARSSSTATKSQSS